MPAASLRDGVAALATLAGRDVDVLWRKMQTADMARDMLKDVLPQLTETYRSASAALAADWYDEQRDQAAVRGRFRAVVPEPSDAGAESLATWAVEPLYAKDPDWPSALTLVRGGLQRRIANASRDTVIGSSVADPAAAGWQRTGTGECAFCAMLIGRGAVYTKATVDFGAHDHCRCGVAPAWGGRPAPVQPYKIGTRHGSKADYDRAKQWIAEHQ